MSRRSKSARRRDAVGFHQRSTTFIDNYKPIGAAALCLLAGTYQAYDLYHKTTERELKGKIVQNEWNVSQNALYASNEDLEHKKYMNQIAEENAEFEQRHRLDEIGHPEWGRNYTATAEYSSYPVERYQEPEQWQPWEEEVDEEEVDERSWYEKKRWQGLALGGIACASTAILSTEREHAEETPPWKQKNLATAAWGVGLVCTGAAIANAINKEERHSESRSAEKRRSHRSNRHSSRAESKHPKSSSRRR